MSPAVQIQTEPDLSQATQQRLSGSRWCASLANIPMRRGGRHLDRFQNRIACWMRMNNTIQQDRYICKRRMISEIIWRQTQNEAPPLYLFSGFHWGPTETLCGVSPLPDHSWGLPDTLRYAALRTRTRRPSRRSYARVSADLAATPLRVKSLGLLGSRGTGCMFEPRDVLARAVISRALRASATATAA